MQWESDVTSFDRGKEDRHGSLPPNFRAHSLLLYSLDELNSVNKVQDAKLKLMART